MRWISDDRSASGHSNRRLGIGTGRNAYLLLIVGSSLACNTDLQLAPLPEHGQPTLVREAVAPDGISQETEASQPVRRASAPAVIAGVRGEFRRRLRETAGPSLGEWRQSLDEIARVSARGEGAVVMRRIVLESLEADSDADFHRILRRLPRRVAELPDQRSDLLTNAYGMSEQSARVSGPNAGFFDASPSDQCSSTWEGVEYVGECATQQEIDDATAVMDALEAELNADYAEAQTACLNRFASSECGPSDEEPYEEEDEFHPAADGGFDGSVGLANSLSSKPDMFAVFHAEVFVTPCGGGDLASGSNGDRVGEASCAGQAVMAVAGVASWILSKRAAWHFIRAGAAATGVGTVVGGIILGALAAGYGVGDYLVCATQ